MKAKKQAGRPNLRTVNTDANTVGGYLQEGRVASGLGLKDVAKKLGVTVAFVCNVEHGRAPLPWNKVIPVSKLLGINPEIVAVLNLRAQDAYQNYSKVMNKVNGYGKVIDLKPVDRTLAREAAENAFRNFVSGL